MDGLQEFVRGCKGPVNGRLRAVDGFPARGEEPPLGRHITAQMNVA
jgi:hypothetical protein